MPNIIRITDFGAKELDVYARLTENQLVNRDDPENGIFIAESPNVIERALDGGCIPLSMLVEEKHIEGEAKKIIARCGDIPVFTSELSVLKNLTGFCLTRGVLCAMRRPEKSDAREICKNAQRVAVLDRVMNPTNVGAIFRSAAALGMDCVLLTPGCSDPLYRRAIRVSMGTVFQIPWAYFPLPLEDGGIDLLHEYGFKCAAMALEDNSVDIDNPSLMGEKRLAVILGTEGDGLSEKAVDGCDYTVKIPMLRGVDSLNVAAAGAVAFWQLSKKE